MPFSDQEIERRALVAGLAKQVEKSATVLVSRVSKIVEFSAQIGQHQVVSYDLEGLDLAVEDLKRIIRLHESAARRKQSGG